MAPSLRLQIVHEVPGRLRARCPTLRENAALAGQFEELARGLPGAVEVTIRPRTASVVFQYDLEAAAPAAFRSALAAGAELAPPPAPVSQQEAGEPLGALAIHRIRRAWRDMDGEVLRRTGGRLDLRSSLPWALLLVAVSQVARRRELAAVPWYTALYYALLAVLSYQAPLPDPVRDAAETPAESG